MNFPSLGSEGSWKGEGKTKEKPQKNLDAIFCSCHHPFAPRGGEWQSLWHCSHSAFEIFLVTSRNIRWGDTGTKTFIQCKFLLVALASTVVPWCIFWDILKIFQISFLNVSSVKILWILQRELTNNLDSSVSKSSLNHFWRAAWCNMYLWGLPTT